MTEKMTEAQREEAIKIASENPELSYEEIAKTYDVSKQYIGKICADSGIKRSLGKGPKPNLERQAAWVKERERKALEAKERREKKKLPALEFAARQRVRQLTMVAIKKGVLIPEPCEECGYFERKNQDIVRNGKIITFKKLGVHAHHDDYSKPLEVRWLCHKHHAAWHAKNKPLPALRSS